MMLSGSGMFHLKSLILLLPMVRRDKPQIDNPLSDGKQLVGAAGISINIGI